MDKLDKLDEQKRSDMKIVTEITDKDQVLTIDEAIKLMTDKVKEINDIWERVEIKDGFYSDEFYYDTRRALITIAVIRALGIGKDAERYLGAVVK